jgi:hypothetical protein
MHENKQSEKNGSPPDPVRIEDLVTGNELSWLREDHDRLEEALGYALSELVERQAMDYEESILRQEIERLDHQLADKQQSD